MEDINDNPSITYIDLCQELASATTALLDVASNILSDNEELVDVDGSTPSLAQSTLEPTKTETPDQSESINQVTKLVKNQEEVVFTRLGLLENRISCLESSIQKTKEDASEIKQWRKNFVTEQSDMGVNIEKLTKKQKQNFKNLRKQMSQQDNKIKELNKEIEILKEKKSKSNKTLEKLSLDIKEYENNLHKINKEMKDHADTTDSITQEIKRHSDQMSTLQEESSKNMLNTSTQLEKQSLMYKLLQQRLMPIDKLIQIFNQNLQTRGKKLTKLENIEDTISKLSKDFNLIICVTLHEGKDKHIRVGVWAEGMLCTTIEVKCADTNAAGSVVVDMKKGQELYFQVLKADQNAALSNYSSFTIVGL
ncbi:chromosome partition protein Smc-like [Physella acuta]|uniref:chromosome partition protein Smc-like n=1 Tax=Physella acuta TaxID=109671 RepID=UPI0027DCF6BD|nr:chromosome partition protein Smc-like [Physella acuta]